jgi:hypothetical protein
MPGYCERRPVADTRRDLLVVEGAHIGDFEREGGTTVCKTPCPTTFCSAGSGVGQGWRIVGQPYLTRLSHDSVTGTHSQELITETGRGREQLVSAQMALLPGRFQLAAVIRMIRGAVAVGVRRPADGSWLVAPEALTAAGYGASWNTLSVPVNVTAAANVEVVITNADPAGEMSYAILDAITLAPP